MDKRELLKGYGVVCRTPEQADKMVEFVGDMFSNLSGWHLDAKVLKWIDSENGFFFNKKEISKNNHKGVKTYEEACAMCEIGEVEPSLERPKTVDFRGAKAGDKVTCLLNGNGVVFDVYGNYDQMIINVQFETALERVDYLCNGSSSDYHSYPSLFFGHFYGWPIAENLVRPEPPKPKMRYMTALEVIQQHTDKWMYKNTEGLVFMGFSSSMIPKMFKVCKDKTQPIDEWKWEELMTEDENV